MYYNFFVSMSTFIQILNQLFEMQTKMQQNQQDDKLERNFNRLFNLCEEQGFTMHNPLGEKYAESRTDCDANIVGKLSNTMVVSQVIKPIIYQNNNGEKRIAQKGIVMIESK